MTDLTEPTQAPAPGGATERAASTAAAAKDQAASVASSAATEAKAVASEAADRGQGRPERRPAAAAQPGRGAVGQGRRPRRRHRHPAPEDGCGRRPALAKDIVAGVADQASRCRGGSATAASTAPSRMPAASRGTGRACSSPVPPWPASSPHGWPVPRTRAASSRPPPARTGPRPAVAGDPGLAPTATASLPAGTSTHARRPLSGRSRRRDERDRRARPRARSDRTGRPRPVAR